MHKADLIVARAAATIPKALFAAKCGLTRLLHNALNCFVALRDFGRHPPVRL